MLYFELLETGQKRMPFGRRGSAGRSGLSDAGDLLEDVAFQTPGEFIEADQRRTKSTEHVQFLS